MPLFETRDLALYAAIVGTANGAWALYNGVVRDRPRIVVKAVRGEALAAGANPQPIFMVSVSNRGRRPVQVSHISYVSDALRGYHMISQDIALQLTPRPQLGESESQTFVHGQNGGYTHGNLPTSRWHVTDGAGRTHPLRERYRQRIERILLWPLRKFLRWRDGR